jgi:hypothetical protein
VPGEMASNHHVVTLGSTNKKVAELRQKMLEVAISMQRLDSCILRRECCHDLRWPSRR